MKTAKILAATGTLIMLITFIYGFVYGDFWGEGSLLLSLAWGQVSLIDVYIGFGIVSAWVAYREVHMAPSLLWIIGIMLLGNFLACAYIWLQLERSGGNWDKFWYGNQYKTNT